MTAPEGEPWIHNWKTFIPDKPEVCMSVNSLFSTFPTSILEKLFLIEVVTNFALTTGSEENLIGMSQILYLGSCKPFNVHGSLIDK